VNVNLQVPDIHPLLQPHDSGVCGQTCVAMAAGVSIDAAVAAVGVSSSNDEGGTFADDMVRGLQKLGVKCGQPTEYGRRGSKRLRQLPERAIMGIDGYQQHWVLLWDGFVYDPGIGWPLPVRAYEGFILDMAYSRPHRPPKKNKSRSVRSYWDTAIPIEKPPPAAV
jgi:hypothetical protein